VDLLAESLRKYLAYWKKNIPDRLEKASSWSNWTLRQWSRVLFSDETMINLFSSDGRVKVWKKRGEGLLSKNIVPTVKHGGGGLMF
jgi:hypothetical protein